MQCIDCFKNNKKDILSGVKWDFPATFIYKGQSYCREHLLKKLKWAEKKK